MAKREKDRIYYEITKEKPFGQFHLLLVGGSAGSVSGFLIASLVGAYEGVEMDTLVLSFLVASFLGFFFGAGLMWLFTNYWSRFVDGIAIPGEGAAVQETSVVEPIEDNPAPSDASSAVLEEGDDSKGKSIDFMFPEFSPDKQ